MNGTLNIQIAAVAVYIRAKPLKSKLVLLDGYTNDIKLSEFVSNEYHDSYAKSTVLSAKHVSIKLQKNSNFGPCSTLPHKTYFISIQRNYFNHCFLVHINFKKQFLEFYTNCIYIKNQDYKPFLHRDGLMLDRAKKYHLLLKRISKLKFRHLY